MWRQPAEAQGAQAQGTGNSDVLRQPRPTRMPSSRPPRQHAARAGAGLVPGQLFNSAERASAAAPSLSPSPLLLWHPRRTKTYFQAASSS